MIGLEEVTHINNKKNLFSRSFSPLKNGIDIRLVNPQMEMSRVRSLKIFIKYYCLNPHVSPLFSLDKANCKTKEG
jgi:hypothetical protein